MIYLLILIGIIGLSIGYLAADLLIKVAQNTYNNKLRKVYNVEAQPLRNLYARK